MKWIIIIALVLMCCSPCYTPKDNYVIHEYDISGDNNIKRYEYFVSNETDTMATSFIVCTNSFGKVNIDVFCDEEYKKYMHVIFPDTMAIIEDECLPNHIFCLSSYRDILSEFEQCLKKAKDHTDIHQLQYISLRLADFPEIAVSVSKQILDNDISHEIIDNALEITSLKGDLNKVLKPYNVEIKCINSYEEILKIKTIPYCRKYGIKMKEMPSSILDTQIELIVDTNDHGVY